MPPRLRWKHPLLNRFARIATGSKPEVYSMMESSNASSHLLLSCRAATQDGGSSWDCVDEDDDYHSGTSTTMETGMELNSSNNKNRTIEAGRERIPKNIFVAAGVLEDPGSYDLSSVTLAVLVRENQCRDTILGTRWVRRSPNSPCYLELDIVPETSVQNNRRHDVLFQRLCLMDGICERASLFGIVA
jgi:hypothetical protein